MTKTKNTIKNNNFIVDVKTIIENAQNNAIRSIDSERVQMYWLIGERIIKEEQGGNKRAEYGKYRIKSLADTLTKEYGSGFSKRILEQARQFYSEYPIANTVCSQLNWSQYRLLTRIEDKEKRKY